MMKPIGYGIPDSGFLENLVAQVIHRVIHFVHIAISVVLDTFTTKGSLWKKQ